MHLSDKELLSAFRAERTADRFQPLLDKYLPLVYASARRQLTGASQASEVAQAVFVALARRAKRLRRRTILADWLFHATSLAVRNSKRTQRRKASLGELPPPLFPRRAEDDSWEKLRVELDAALRKLSRKYRQAVLVHLVLNQDLPEAAKALRIRPKRVAARSAKGVVKLSKRLRKKQVVISGDQLAELLREKGALVSDELASPTNLLHAGDAVEATTTPLSDVKAAILAAVLEDPRQRPTLELARSTLQSLTWAQWKRRFKFVSASVGIFVAMLATIIGCLAVLWQTGHLLPWLMIFGAQNQVREVPELAKPARPWPQDASQPLLMASSLADSSEVYRVTNIWKGHLRFTAAEWAALEPKRVPPVRQLMTSDGTIHLRNPNASRNGLAGAIGFDFQWTHAQMEFGGVHLTNVACRYRGNGTYLNSLWGPKRPFKVDLDKFEKDQRLLDVRTLNFGNLTTDSSFMSDALAYEFFHAAGVPAPRTAYAWLVVTAPPKFENKDLGLYLLLENLDTRFAQDRFGTKKVAIFKPVTYDLFLDLGADWTAYDSIYDPKTKVTPEQTQRVIDFARLLTHSSDEEFARSAAVFLDLDEFARFLGGLVLLSSYDGFLSTGQNYYIYLDPQSNKFGFIPWDLDHAWGGIPFVGTPTGREQASIWRPWVSRNRLLERLMKLQAFRDIYKARLEEMMAQIFVPERLEDRIDEIAGAIRSAVAAESDFRLRRFEQAVSTNWVERPEKFQEGPKAPVHQLKRFIRNRAQSVRDQLEGKSNGIELKGFRPE